MDHLVDAHICASGKVSFFPLPNHEVDAFLSDDLTSKRGLNPQCSFQARGIALWCVAS